MTEEGERESDESINVCSGSLGSVFLLTSIFVFSNLSIGISDDTKT